METKTKAVRTINDADSRKAKAMLTLTRVLVYLFLGILTLLCLFSFYMLIINSTRTNADLQGGFRLLPRATSWRT